MSEKELHPIQTSLQGDIQVPGDKSISHRAVIFGALANGETTITNFLDGEDCLRTIDAFKSMGVTIEKEGKTVIINSKGVKNLQEPTQPIYLGNSGTTTRLLLGVLAGLPYHFSLYGDDSLTKRPMDRIVKPLREMGATIDGRENGNYLPLSVRGAKLNSISFQTPVKSAQVKSGVLLAGILANGTTEVIEQTTTRDHTENMLSAFGGVINRENGKVSVNGKQVLNGIEVNVPGDISSAAFFLVAAAIVRDSSITISNVGLNPTRTGIIDVLEQMGADIRVSVEKEIGAEPIGSIEISHQDLNGITIDGEIIPRIIDELPIVALLATQATGKTIIKDAEELRYKETDRIEAVVNTLKAIGADIEGTNDGMVINGKSSLHGAEVDSYGDHRIGMMIAIASLIATDKIVLNDPECIAISYPTFFDDFATLI